MTGSVGPTVPRLNAVVVFDEQMRTAEVAVGGVLKSLHWSATRAADCCCGRTAERARANQRVEASLARRFARLRFHASFLAGKAASPVMLGVSSSTGSHGVSPSCVLWQVGSSSCSREWYPVSLGSGFGFILRFMLPFRPDAQQGRPAYSLSLKADARRSCSRTSGSTQRHHCQHWDFLPVLFRMDSCRPPY